MKKLFILVMLLPPLSLAAPKTITCPTVKEANRLFHGCKINSKKESCRSVFHNIELVLDSPVEVVYGGKHRFSGFTHFQAIDILSGNFICKYAMIPTVRKMGWIIASRYALDKRCHLLHAKSVLGISSCENADPQKCQILCD